MLTQPEYGWTYFGLEGTPRYLLSYLDDIAFDWLEEAIHGLERFTPFCVQGSREPGRMICVVTYYNCWIIDEEEDGITEKMEDAHFELSHTGMLDFCHMLYDDVMKYVDEWVLFTSYVPDDDASESFNRRREVLLDLLDRLHNLIIRHEERFNRPWASTLN